MIHLLSIFSARYTSRMHYFGKFGIQFSIHRIIVTDSGDNLGPVDRCWSVCVHHVQNIIKPCGLIHLSKNIIANDFGARITNTWTW